MAGAIAGEGGSLDEIEVDAAHHGFHGFHDASEGGIGGGLASLAGS